MATGTVHSEVPMTGVRLAAIVFAAGVQAADAGTAWDGTDRIEARLTYVYTASDRPVLAAGGAAGRSFTRESHVIVTGNPPGPIGHLRGRCTGIGMLTAASGYTLAGWCLLKDAEGDMIVERFEEASPERGAAVAGTGIVRGGTGKFAGISGAFEFVTHRCAAPLHDACHGAGRRVGVWRLPGD
jgi:hypothetical protein